MIMKIIVIISSLIICRCSQWIVFKEGRQVLDGSIVRFGHSNFLFTLFYLSFSFYYIYSQLLQLLERLHLLQLTFIHFLLYLLNLLALLCSPSSFFIISFYGFTIATAITLFYYICSYLLLLILATLANPSTPVYLSTISILPVYL